MRARDYLVLTALTALTALLGARDARADSCIPGFDNAAFGKASVTFTGGSITDSYDSSVGTYDATKQDANGGIGTNGTSCGAIALSGNGTTINGNIAYGPGGTACSISGSPPAIINGSAGAMSAPVSLPSVAIPAVGSNQGNRSPSPHATLTVASNQTYDTVSAKSGSHLVLQAGTYVVGSLTLSGNSDLTVGSGPVLVYVDCHAGSGLDLSGGTVANASLKSTDLVFMVGPSCGSAKVSGGASSSFAVYAPDTNVAVTGGSDLYGAIIGKTVSVTGGTQIHYDRALASFATGQFKCPAIEISRAAPIVASIGGDDHVVQGTYEFPSLTRVTATPSNVASWEFSLTLGHMRAVKASALSSDATKFGGAPTGSTLFDAADGLPSPSNGGCGSFTGSCRQIFTTTNATPSDGLTFHPTRVTLSDATASTVGPLITSALSGTWSAANHQALIRAILKAPLGGVDHSTVAVVGPSQFAGSSRPTVAYFGATDGMLHAVCVTPGGSTPTSSSVCPSAGTELWAFLPRVQLPLVGTLDTRIDGSVHVVDAVGDFTTEAANTRKQIRTILTFQTGFSYGAGAPAAYALNVTDPANPTILWEYTTPTSPAALDFGTGLIATPGVATVGGATTNLVVLETNNGGTGGAGVVATALRLENGAKLWQFGSLYPTADGVPATGIPGGAVGVDLTNSGLITDLVMGDLRGNLWRLDPGTGTSKTGTSPLFKFTTVRHPIGVPPAIYSNGGALYAAFVSGGYTDPLASAWTTTQQFLIAVKIKASSTPVTEAASACPTCDLGVKVALSGVAGYARAVIVGTTLQAVADSADVNSSAYGTTKTASGTRISVNVVTGASATSSIYSGAGALGVSKGASGATLISSGSDKQHTVASGVSTTGTSINLQEVSKLVRKLWVLGEP